MKLEFRYRFEAAHRFLKSESIPCMTPHGHTWYASMSLSFKNASLNDSQMTVEFSQIKKDWKTLIQETFDHSYMHNINDPVIEVLNNGDQSPRLIPFPGDPTTELISLFMFHKMETIIQNSSFSETVEVSAIRLDETPTNSIICDREYYANEHSRFASETGWWTNTDPHSRIFATHD